MTTKHAPATPLPWETVEANATIPIRGANGHTVASVRYDERYDGPDAAYIAHAANAYPRLVEAIQNDLRGYLGDFPPNHPATILRDLLRSLGEEA